MLTYGEPILAERSYFLQVVGTEEAQLYLAQDAQRYCDRRRRHRDCRRCHGGRRRRATTAADADSAGAGRTVPRNRLIRSVRSALLDVGRPDVARDDGAIGFTVVDLRQDHRQVPVKRYDHRAAACQVSPRRSSFVSSLCGRTVARRQITATATAVARRT